MSTNIHKPLRIQHDEKRDVIIIEGVSYAGEFFRTIRAPESGVLYELFSNRRGVITLRRSTKECIHITPNRIT